MTTPAQKQYDLDLAASMQAMATWVMPRSKKVSDTLILGAQRITALANEAPVTASLAATEQQPASTPAPRKRKRAR